jgi:hypothetical protein
MMLIRKPAALPIAKPTSARLIVVHVPSASVLRSSTIRSTIRCG